MSATSKVREPGTSAFEIVTGLVIIGIVVAAAVIGWAALWLGTALAGVRQHVPGSPVAAVTDLVHHRLVWPTASTVVAVSLALITIAAAAAAYWKVLSRRSKRLRVDQAAKQMAGPKELRSLQAKAVNAKAEQLVHSEVLATSSDRVWGVPIGRTVIGDMPLWADYELLHLDIWGPRQGKSTSRVIPGIVAAPGAVITTSNKRDVVDATRLLRSKRLVDPDTGRPVRVEDVDWTVLDPARTQNAPGGQPKAAGKVDPRRLADRPVWVFDPQQVALEEPTWWWNPLSYVVDDVTATALAQRFRDDTTSPDAKTDAFFDPAGLEVLASMILAAALDQQMITQVYAWLMKPTDRRPADILAAHGYPEWSDGLLGHINSPDKQRGGVYGTARKLAACLKFQHIKAWVAPLGPDDDRPQFDPAAFLADHATLYLLSKEGPGSAGALVSALTMATLEAADKLGARSPRGRCPVPVYAPLDEIANVVRWSNLPQLYSHFGSRGIIVDAILQSYAQGREVWGAQGMAAMWSAANIVVYGGGVRQRDWLADVSALIGSFKRMSHTHSASQGSGSSGSVSRHWQSEIILDVDDLQALPRGRAVLFSSGNPAALIKTTPWIGASYAPAIETSIKIFDPAGSKTLSEIYAGLDRPNTTTEMSQAPGMLIGQNA